MRRCGRSPQRWVGGNLRSARRQPRNEEVPAGGEEGDHEGDRGASLGTHGPATAHPGDLLLVPGAVQQVVDGLVADGLRHHQALLGGSVQEALRQVRLVGDGTCQSDDVDRTAVKCVVHALTGAKSASQHDGHRQFFGEPFREFEEVRLPCAGRFSLWRARDHRGALVGAAGDLQKVDAFPFQGVGDGQGIVGVEAAALEIGGIQLDGDQEVSVGRRPDRSHRLDEQSHPVLQ